MQEKKSTIFKSKEDFWLTIENLIEDSDKYTFDAAKKKGFQLELPNNFQSLVKTKEDELKELYKMVESLSIRKKNF